jgi:uncharacterized membrane protein
MLQKSLLLNTAWDLFLAAIPVGLGYGAATLGRRARQQRKAMLWIGFAVLMALWLAFVPNTCYLLTEWRHFLNQVDSRNLYQRSQHQPGLLLHISLLALFYLGFSGFGAMSLALAIRPIERLLREWRIPFLVIALPLFMLLSLGVYLGLIVRLNSWDLWTRPLHVWRYIAEVPSRPSIVAAVAVFGLFLWGLYEALDLWVDAFQQRLRRKR